MCSQGVSLCVLMLKKNQPCLEQRTRTRTPPMGGKHICQAADQVHHTLIPESNAAKKLGPRGCA